LHIHERISTQALLKAPKGEEIQGSLSADPEQEYNPTSFYNKPHDLS
jgi:hypothetical protein